MTFPNLLNIFVLQMWPENHEELLVCTRSLGSHHFPWDLGRFVAVGLDTEHWGRKG